MYASDYRRMARETLRGKWRTTMSIVLLAQLVFLYFGLDEIYKIFFAEAIPINYEGQTFYLNHYLGFRPVGIGWVILAVLILFEFVSMMVTVGEYSALSALCRGETPRVRQLFPWKLFGKALLMNLVRALLVSLWSLLFVIPGIIAIFRYSMADYLLSENPELGPIQALRESRLRMMGHKGELFCLQFSFFGWSFLATFASTLLDQLFYTMQLNSLVYALLTTVAALAIYTPLNTYMLTTQTLFFARLMGEPSAARASQFNAYSQQGQSAWADASTAYQQAASDAPEAENERKYADLGADESAAREMFIQNGCSRNRLREAGLIGDYEALRPSSVSEASWRRDYSDELVRRFDRDPSALAELLDLSAEYADEPLVNRVLARIERHIRQQTLPDKEILDMAGRTIAMLTSGAFSDPGFLERRREQVLDMTERLSERLSQTDPEGSWQSTAKLVRQLCGKEGE